MPPDGPVVVRSGIGGSVRTSEPLPAADELGAQFEQLGPRRQPGRRL